MKWPATTSYLRALARGGSTDCAALSGRLAAAEAVGPHGATEEPYPEPLNLWWELDMADALREVAR